MKQSLASLQLGGFIYLALRLFHHYNGVRVETLGTHKKLYSLLQTMLSFYFLMFGI